VVVIGLSPLPCHPRARTLGFAECGPGVLADCLGQGTLPLGGWVQVDGRGPAAVVTHAFHQLTGVRAFVGDEDVATVPQVVEVGAGQAGTGERRCPDATVEVAVSQRLTVRTGEDQRRGLVERPEMLAELGCDEVGDGGCFTWPLPA
jgi:hypothetical protein